MTSATVATSAVAIHERSRVDRVAIVVSIGLTASGLVHGVVLILSGDTWEGPLSFRKAASFGLSFGITLLTVAWASSYVQMGRRARAVTLGAFTAACALETALVTMQVWRGVPSHYNLETPFDTVVAMSLAFGGAVIVITSATFTIAALRTVIEPAMRIALGYGFVCLMASLLVGAKMIAKGIVLARDGRYAEAYATGGSLKPLHAATLHAVLIIPGLAVLLRRVPIRSDVRTRLVVVACVLYTGMVAAVAVAAT